VAIIDQIEDHDTLRSLARTSSQLQRLTEPLLYESIFLRTGKQAARLLEGTTSRPERALSIHSLEARCTTKWARLQRLYALASIIKKSRSLEHLTVESPYCNDRYSQDDEEWDDVLLKIMEPMTLGKDFIDHNLAHLTRLTIHWSGKQKRYWPISSALAMIFAHPTLQSLTISCAHMRGLYIQCLNGSQLTPLRSLEFIECNIDLTSLETILSLPKALESLSLGK
jgi:hypothetical protein